MTMAPSRILVVDDEADICRNLQDILTDLGNDVAIAFDGTEGLRLIQERSFDVALLDFKMPGMDGLTLYREIRSCRPETVAILVTAYATPETTAQALGAGAWRVLSKPVDLQSLLGLVEAAAQQPLILIVDDDADLCDSLWDVLRGHGFRVAIAHDEASATAYVEQECQDVVLIDLKLPDGSGSNVLHAVRSSNSKARVVLITGYRTEMQEVIDRAIAEGADTICYKPFDVPGLVRTIEGLARTRRIVDE
jgi:two-component system response regulator HydG